MFCRAYIKAKKIGLSDVFEAVGKHIKTGEMDDAGVGPKSKIRMSHVVLAWSHVHGQ